MFYNMGTILRPLWLVGLFLCSGALVSAAERRPRELCVCGYNTRMVCDGSYYHFVSDCLDETGAYCGYDDQTDGPCDQRTSRLRKVLRYPFSKSKTH